jgi:hypothetical protein
MDTLHLSYYSGDPTCPSVSGSDINARVFAAVTLDEKVK